MIRSKELVDMFNKKDYKCLSVKKESIDVSNVRDIKIKCLGVCIEYNINVVKKSN